MLPKFYDGADMLFSRMQQSTIERWIVIWMQSALSLKVILPR